jgi:hypothetical protein
LLAPAPPVLASVKAPRLKIAADDAGAGGSTTDGGSSEEVSMGQPDLSAEANSDYRGGVPPGADVLDSNLTAPTIVAPTTTVAPHRSRRLSPRSTA